MPKRSYRKKSSRGKKGSRKGSKKSYRKKGSRKGSKKSYRKKGSKKSNRRRTIRKSRKASPCKDLDEAECGYNPSCEYKTNKFGTKYCKSRSGTLYKKKLSKRLTKVQGPMGPPEGYVPKENKLEDIFDYSGDLDFNLQAMGYRIKKRGTKGSKRKSRGKSRKTSRGKKSRGKKSRGKKSRKNSGFRSRHMM
jgi:hypothetical protein